MNLLAAANRKLVQEIGWSLVDTDGFGSGQLVMGCRQSGTRILVTHVLDWMDDDGGVVHPKCVVDMQVMPSDKYLFVKELGMSIISAIDGTEDGPSVSGALVALRESSDPISIRGIIQDVLDLGPTPVAIVFHGFDCVSSTHLSLDGFFGSFRDVVIATGTRCLVTCLRDIDRKQVGASRFANNFGRHWAQPVMASDVCAAWSDEKIDGRRAGYLVTTTFGPTERGAQLGLKRLKRLVQDHCDQLDARMRSAAKSSRLVRDAMHYWEEIDALSQKALLKHIDGGKMTENEKNYILAHPWAPYYLRLTDGQVELCDAALVSFVERANLGQLVVPPRANEALPTCEYENSRVGQVPQIDPQINEVSMTPESNALLKALTQKLGDYLSRRSLYFGEYWAVAQTFQTSATPVVQCALDLQALSEPDRAELRQVFLTNARELAEQSHMASVVDVIDVAQIVGVGRPQQ
jgi:hypothetical protein